jgi:tetratricopeptide (TPR) repeat protein
VLAAVYQARGLMRVALHDFAGAIEDYGQALGRRPDAETYTCRGWAHVRAESLSLALTDFQEAIRLHPATAEAYNGRGHVHALRGQYGEAIRDAQAALDRQPKDPRTCLNAAHVFAQIVGGMATERGTRGREAPYQDRALELVQRALERTHPRERAAFWRDTVAPDPALRPIRNSPEFRRLADQYSQAAR